MNRLTELKKQGFDECCLKIEHWKKFKSDYDALQQRLTTLPDKLAYDIMVPFGPHAFVPGTLVNTNNVTVLLGDNWFTEMSAKQAVQFIQRRIEQCNKMLEDLEKEKKQYHDFLEMAENISEEQPKEIIEVYDEEKLKQWRETHRKNVRLYKQQEAKKRVETKNFSSSEPTMSSSSGDKMDDDYFKRLDELYQSECEEALKNFITATDDDDLSDDEEEEESDEKLESDSQSPTSQQTLEEQNEKSPSPDSDLNQNKSDKHVRWIDLSEAKSKCITFTHSKPPPNKHQHYKKANKRRRRNSSQSQSSDFDEESEDKTGTVINSPSDIYKCFSFSMQPSKPKSILKSSSSETLIPNDKLQDMKIYDDDSSSDQKENEVLEPFQFPSKTKKQKNSAFTGEVKECYGENTHEVISPSQRPKSLFQRSRQGGRT